LLAWAGGNGSNCCLFCTRQNLGLKLCFRVHSGVLQECVSHCHIAINFSSAHAQTSQLELIVAGDDQDLL